MRKSINVLLVEDSPTDALLFKTFLGAVTEFSFNIETVNSLNSATTSAQRPENDVIILDLGLPDSYGISTFTKMREVAPSKPIIILSGNEDRTVIAEAMDRGADNYIIKDSADGNRIAIAIISSMRNRNSSQGQESSN